MKKIIIIAFVLLSVPLFGAENITKYKFGNSIDNACRVLKIDPSIPILVKYLPRHFKLDDYSIQGATVMHTNGQFTIYIKRGLTNKMAEIAMVHELVHVWQNSSGKLVHKNSDSVIWQGWLHLDISGEDQYNLPWESEARLLTPVIIKKLDIF